MTTNIDRHSLRVFLFMEKQNALRSLKNESEACIFFMVALNGIDILITIIKFDNIISLPLGFSSNNVLFFCNHEAHMFSWGSEHIWTTDYFYDFD